MNKPIQTLQELAKNLKPDCYYIVSPCSAGDTYRLCTLHSALESKYKSKIIVIIKAMHEAVCEMFEGLEYVICEDKSVDFCASLQCLKLENVVSMPKLGKIYSHFINYGLHIYANNQLDFDRLCLMLPQNAQRVLPTNLPTISQDLRARLEKIAPLDKIILLCPEANSFPRLPYIIFKHECQRLRKEGYHIVLNILKYKQEYARFFDEGMYDLDLSLKEAIALGIHCAGVISVRAGFCDIVSPHCKHLSVFYTDFEEYILWDNDLICATRIFIRDLNYYKDFVISVENALPFRLFQRYAAKGFWRRLRTPFSCYKIYKKHKTSQAHLDKNLNNDLESELALYYEYQLGLALQRACERFWLGGFFTFAFSYINLRKSKKTFLRLNAFGMTL